MKNIIPEGKNQYISKPLKLNTVPKSETSSDNILVQGDDKIVKSVTRSEFEAGIINGTPNNIPKINNNGQGLQNSAITENDEQIFIDKKIEINSGIENQSGLKFTNLQNNADYTSSLFTTVGNDPRSIVIDSNDNAYISSINNNRVTKVTKSGVVSTFNVGTGPYRLIKDNQDNIYSVNYASCDITKISSAGVVSTFGKWAGIYAFGICINSATGDFYVVSNTYARIYKVSKDGITTDFAYAGNDPYALVCNSSGDLFVTNVRNRTISKIDSSGVRTIFATCGTTGGIYDLYMDRDENLYTGNYSTNEVYKITPDGQVITLGIVGAAPRAFVKDDSNNLYVANTDASTVSKISPNGEITTIGSTGPQPFGIALDSSNTIYTVNKTDGSVTKLESPKNKVLTVDQDGNVVLSNKEIITKSDFKTINGENIIGEGDIKIKSGGSQTLDQVLESGNTAVGKQIVLADDGNTGADPSYGSVTVYRSNGLDFRQYTENGGPYAKGIGINSEGIHFSAGDGDLPRRTTLRAFQRGNVAQTLDLPYSSGMLVTTVNGQSADSFGNVVVSDGGGSQNLDQVLNAGNTTSENAIFSNNGYTTTISSNNISVNEPTVGTTSIQPSNIQILNTNGNVQAILKGDGLSMYNSSGQNSARLINNSASIYSGNYKFPLKINDNDDEDQTLVTTDDFKTINGESIIGTGDISIGEGAIGLDSVLTTKNHANSPLILSDYYQSPEYYQGLNLSASTGNTKLENHYSGWITSTLELKPGNLGLRQTATDSSGEASMEIHGGGFGNAPIITFEKYINGERSYCPVTAGDPVQIDDLTTKRYVDSQITAKAAVNSPTFTGIPTVPTAVLNTNTSQIASTAFVNETVNNFSKNFRPYKVWTAVISQSSTAAPEINSVYQNDFGGTIVASRVDVGTYLFTLEGAFRGNFLSPQNGTLMFQSCCDSYGTVSVSKLNDNQIQVRTITTAMDVSDQLLGENMIEFRIYN